MKKNSLIGMLAAVLFVGGIGNMTFAQPVPGQGGPAGQGFGQGRGQGGGNFDPNAMRQRISDSMKEALGASDEEWKVLGPKVEKVQALQQDTGSGMSGIQSMMRRMGGGGGRGGAANLSSMFGGNPNSEVQIKSQDLEKALDNPNATENEIHIKLMAVREARERAKVQLAQARKELTELLTQRQEALLFQMGVLE